MFVIAGVTGHTGKTVAETLLGKGKKVRVIVRKPEQGAAWKARGAEVAIASVDDEAALAQAFAGAEGAYLLSPPTPTSDDPLAQAGKVAAAIAGAVRTSKLPHIVFLSSIGAHLPGGTGPIQGVGRAEKVLAETGAATTFVRAAYFLENFGGVLPVAKADGILPSFLPAGFTHPIVTTTDIGRTAAQALLDGPRGRRVIELSGPEDTSAADVATRLTAILGRPVKVVEAGLDAVVPTFKSFGMSQAMAELYREMYAGFGSGKITYEGKGTERVRGTVDVSAGLKQLLG
jgi:uncharacterized protein YbjT (DUF2867 family)